jgi:hypothetical protein
MSDTSYQVASPADAGTHLEALAPDAAYVDTQVEPPRPTPKLRTFKLGDRHQLSYMRANSPDGWAHEEGPGEIMRSLFSLTHMVKEIAPGRHMPFGWRLILGSHCFWLVS